MTSRWSWSTIRFITSSRLVHVPFHLYPQASDSSPKSSATAHRLVPSPTQKWMSSNEKPHAGLDATSAAANPAATILFFFMPVFSLSCEGSYTRRGASPGFRLQTSSASFAGPPGPTGQRRFVSGYSCATAPDFHGLPFSSSQKRRILYSFPLAGARGKAPWRFPNFFAAGEVPPRRARLSPCRSQMARQKGVARLNDLRYNAKSLHKQARRRHV